VDEAELSIGVVFNDEAVLDRDLRPSIAKVSRRVRALEVSNVDNVVSTNIASLYNVLLRVMGPDVTALLHPDVAFDEHFVDDLFAAVETLERAGKSWGALGIVGRTWSGEYVWCHEIQSPVQVCSLDSCSLITRRSLGMTFDHRRFDEFHCYVEDYCLQAQARGHEVYVFPANAQHNSATMKALGSQWGSYRKYRRRLKWKWRRRFGQIFTC
jgi:hypothetical protein